jgi:Ca-activated chloride channel homolog
MMFGNPKMLWLLLGIPPALVAFFWWSARVRERLLTQFVQARLLPTLTVGISPRRQRIRLGCLVLAVACLILALARPQWGYDWQEVKQRGLDIVVAIDTSKSMLAEDIAPNRLARAKLAALDLMQRAKADRLGLVAFAGTAFLQCPLTIDDVAFRQSVESLDVNTLPQGGTAIAEAISTALTAFKEGDSYKILVLFTDGEDHDSGAVEAAEKAAKEGLRIYTIGIGTQEGEILRVKDARGNSDYVRDEHGDVVKSHLNQQLLQQIAGATEGGFYLPLRGAKVIDTLYDQGLAALPKSQHQEKFIRQYHERFYWPLAMAIVLLLFEMLFPERKRERSAKHAKDAKQRTSGGPPPIPATVAPARPVQAPAPALQPTRSLSSLASLLSLALLSGCLLFPASAPASPSSALREYKSGNYEQALKEYERLLKKNKDDPRLHFNAGAAAYKNRQFEEAAKEFNATLAAPDLKLQGLGYYNEGNALYHLGEGNPDPAKRKEAWEKALQDFQSTMKLNPQDPDAKHNYEFVKKMLEELKQQPQQQSKQDKQDQDKQKRNQEQQNQQKQDQQKQQQQEQAKQDQKQESSKQQSEQQKQQQAEQEEQKQKAQQAQQAEQKKQEQQQAQQAEQKKQEEQKAQQASAQQDKSGEKGQEAAMAQMTPEQAKQLLDSEKDDEKMLQPKSTGKPSDASRPFKDW